MKNGEEYEEWFLLSFKNDISWNFQNGKGRLVPWGKVMTTNPSLQLNVNYIFKQRNQKV